MQLEFVPLLHMQRELHSIPRGWDRFRSYLDAMQPGTENTVAPLFVMNPMGKEHVAARLDQLIALKVETAAVAATKQAQQWLDQLPGQLKVGLVLADDVAGGWTNRYLTEAQLRFGYMTKPQKHARDLGAASFGWVVTMLWVSDEPSRERVRQEVLAATYRTLYSQRNGMPITLRQMLAQEGLAAVFAGSEPPPLDDDERVYSWQVLQPHLDSTDFPTLFACLYGDEAAYAVGYPLLGLSARAGYTVGYHQAQSHLQRSGQTAVAAMDVSADELIVF
jgi:hypothetical protein